MLLVNLYFSKPYFWESHLSDDHQLRRWPYSSDSVKQSISCWRDLRVTKGGNTDKKLGFVSPAQSPCVPCPKAPKPCCWFYRSIGIRHRQHAERQELRRRKRTWAPGRPRGCWGRRGRETPGGWRRRAASLSWTLAARSWSRASRLTIPSIYQATKTSKVTEAQGSKLLYSILNIRYHRDKGCYLTKLPW